MCFSEPVSFAACGVLIAGGAFASCKAWKINKKYLPIAFMPVSEPFIWSTSSCATNAAAIAGESLRDG